MSVPAGAHDGELIVRPGHCGDDRPPHTRLVDRLDSIADDVGDFGVVGRPRRLALLRGERVCPQLQRAGGDVHRPNVVAAECGVHERRTQLARRPIRRKGDPRAVARPYRFAVIIVAAREPLNAAPVGIDQHDVEVSAVRGVVALERNSLAVWRDLRPGRVLKGVGDSHALAALRRNPIQEAVQVHDDPLARRRSGDRDIGPLVDREPNNGGRGRGCGCPQPLRRRAKKQSDTDENCSYCNHPPKAGVPLSPRSWVS